MSNSSMTMQKYYMHLIVTLVLIVMPLARSHGPKEQECKCMCSGYSMQSVCEHLDDIKVEVDASTEELKKWAQFFPFVQHLRNKWRDEIVSIVQTEMKRYVTGGNLLPKPESLVTLEDEMMNDSIMISTPSKNDGELAKNVSSLLAKVEMVENRTMEVEEELKSERRVRRHLQQDLKETQSSIISLGDQLQNVTVPVDAILSHVQMVIFTSLEDMNRTFYEDHLQKLYYKVDGVVYQNETRKLDERLGHVETELHDVTNDSLVAKLAEDVKSLEENIVVLNSSIGNDLTPRLTSLESDTVKKDTAAELEEKMEVILNNTELFKVGLVDIWADIQDFRGFQKKLQNFTEEWTMSLKNLQTQIDVLENKTSENNTASFVDSPDGTDSDRDGYNDTVNDDITVIHNDSNNGTVINNPERDDTTDTDASTDTEEINNDVVTDWSVNNDTSEIVATLPITEAGEAESNDVTIWYNKTIGDEVTTNISERTRMGKDSDADHTMCVVPLIKDPELLADIEEDLDGDQTLIFGCRSIGQYTIANASIPVRCVKGTWKGPFPSCQQLADESKIEQIAEQLKMDHPCFGRSGEFPDPSDCSKFFKCSHGTATSLPCPAGLHFNVASKICDYPKSARCTPVKNELIQELHDLIPPIHIEPNNLDKPNSLLGTGTSGQLIVHPRSSFTLHCLYPETFWGVPVWNITYFKSDRVLKPIPIDGKNKMSLTVTSAKEEDSGIYWCRAPFGKQHAVRVVVKAVHCPPINLGEEYEEVYYRPTPEGEQRILGTTAEYRCEEGGKVSVVCMAKGNWSRGAPGPEECTVKKRQADDGWKCQSLDSSKYPNLILERKDREKIVVFKCAGRMRLIGNSFTRCLDDGFWSHTSLPKCIN